MELENFISTFMPLRKKLQSFARGMLLNDDDAEDAVQEAYLRIWKIRDTLVNHPNAQGFMMQTLKNICIDKIRAEKTNVSLDFINLSDSGTNPYLHTEQSDSIHLVKQIIETLPELQKRILVMRDVEGYELSEIAQIIGSETTAVTMNLSRGRKKVREKFLSINKMI